MRDRGPQDRPPEDPASGPWPDHPEPAGLKLVTTLFAVMVVLAVGAVVVLIVTA